MLVRPLAPSEVSALAALARDTYAEAFGSDMAPKDLRFVLEERLSDACFRRAITADTLLVADDEGSLVGFVQFGAVATAGGDVRPGDREIRRLYVRAPDQSRGIGGKLLAAALASVAPSATVYLDVWQDNHRAQALYRRHGFEVVGSHELMLANGPTSGRELIMARRPKARSESNPAAS